jgi:hypothetical protein
VWESRSGGAALSARELFISPWGRARRTVAEERKDLDQELEVLRKAGLCPTGPIGARARRLARLEAIVREGAGGPRARAKNPTATPSRKCPACERKLGAGYFKTSEYDICETCQTELKLVRGVVVQHVGRCKGDCPTCAAVPREKNPSRRSSATRRASTGNASRPDRVFAAVYPTGVVYADRARQKHGDYARCAFLSFDTLVLVFEADCPEGLKAEIRKDAAKIQVQRGKPFQVSASGHSVILGRAKNPRGGRAPLRPRGLMGEAVVPLEQARHAVGFEAAKAACIEFHGGEPVRARVFEYDDGRPGVRERAVVSLGRADETVYTVNASRSTKAGTTYVHSHREGGGRLPFETFDPTTGILAKLGGTYDVRDWIRH